MVVPAPARRVGVKNAQKAFERRRKCWKKQQFGAEGAGKNWILIHQKAKFSLQKNALNPGLQISGGGVVAS